MATSSSNSPQLGRFYSCREAAKLLDLSDDTIRRLIHAGKLDGFRIGKRILRVTGDSLCRVIKPAEASTEGESEVSEGKGTERQGGEA